MAQKKLIEEGKALLKSKNFWFGALFVLNGIAGLFGYNEFTPSPELSDFTSMATGLIIIFLRLKTNQPITKLR